MRRILMVMFLIFTVLPLSGAADAVDIQMNGSRQGATISGTVESSSGSSASRAQPRSPATPTVTSTGSSTPVQAPRTTETKRGIVYDYTQVGGGKMRYVFDKTSDGYCRGGETTMFCYGPRPERENGRPGRRAPVPPPLTPTEIVERTIVNVRLPSPKPNIDPGYAVTGLKAYLETGNSRTHTFETIPTVLGPLSITATSSYTVNWGDGTTTGPHASNGGRYPDGDITHVYRDAETVDVTVTQNWTAQWSLAGQSGTITGLSSRGELPNFVVREIQAVRRR